MTIAEKSTELGIDLAQIALDANIIMTVKDGDDVFKCYCAGGEAKNINVVDDNGVVISDTSKYYRYGTFEFTEETTLYFKILQIWNF
jgi:hypothetical protein